MDGWRQNILTEVGELRDARSGRRVEILSSQPGVTLYTGNRLGGGCPETKSGGRYRDYEGSPSSVRGIPMRSIGRNFLLRCLRLTDFIARRPSIGSVLSGR